MPGERAQGQLPDWASLIRDVPDFPEPGVLFRDVTPLLADSRAFLSVVSALASYGRSGSGHVVVDKVAGIEARGFVLAAPVALELQAGFVPVRKAGKLPGVTLSQSYALEYGTATLEITRDAFRPDDRVLVIDDVLATGGTIDATAQLIERAGAEVSGVAVLMELAALDGRRRLGDLPLHALMTL